MDRRTLLTMSTFPGRLFNGVRCRDANGVLTRCGCTEGGCACGFCDAPAARSYRVEIAGVQLDTARTYSTTGPCGPPWFGTFEESFHVASPSTLDATDLCVACDQLCVWRCLRRLADTDIVVSWTTKRCGGNSFTKGDCDHYLEVTVYKLSATEAVVQAAIGTGGVGLVIFRATVATTSADCLPVGVAIPNEITDYGDTDLAQGNGVTVDVGKGGTLTLVDERCTCDAGDCAYAESVATDQPVWFTNTANEEVVFAAGTYTVEYLCGAADYDAGDGAVSVSVNKNGSIGIRIVDESGTVLATAPGGTTTYPTAAACEAANSGATTTVTLSSPGKIGIKFVGEPTYKIGTDGVDAGPTGSTGGLPSFRICGATAVDCYEVTCPYTTETYVLFNGGASFPAGDYTVEYVRGAVKYGAAFDYSVNLDTRGYYIGTEVVDPDTGLTTINHAYGTAPGSTTQYATQAACEAGNAGASVTFTHGGGTIGIDFVDDPVGDNTIDTSAVVYRLCPA